MLGNLSAIVMGHREAHRSRKMSECVAARSHHLIGGFVGDEDGSEVQAGAFGKGSDGSRSLAIAHDEITLPVARSLFGIHLARTFGNVSTIGNARPVFG